MPPVLGCGTVLRPALARQGSLLWAGVVAARRVTSALATDDCLDPYYRQLFEQITALVDAGAPPGSPMVLAALERGGKEHGRVGELLRRALIEVTLVGSDPVALGHYAEAVLAQSYRRGFHTAAVSMAQAAEQRRSRAEKL